jgi:phage repressor protein C with HTH and peptisase S24 domain
MSDYGFDGFFRRACEAAGISSQQELSRLLGVNRSAVTQAKKRDNVPENWIYRLARDLGVSAEWLESGRGEAEMPAAAPPRESEFAQVPKVRARLCAGGGSFEVEGEVEDYYAFRNEWIRRKGSPDSMVLMDIVGNSMEPEISNGDTVLIDQSRKDVIAGAIYAVGIEDTVMVKRVEKRPGAIILLSDNPEYTPIELRGDEAANARIIGRVVWACREFS